MTRAPLALGLSLSLSLSLSVGALLAAAGARADQIFIPEDVFEAFPPVDSALPENGTVALFGANVPDISFVRVGADGVELQLVHEQLESEEGIYLVTVGPLVAGETLLVASRCPSCSFTGTWTVIDVLDDAAPSFGDEPVTAEAFAIKDQLGFGVRGYDIQVSLPSLDDDFGPVLALVLRAGAATHVQNAGGGAVQAFLFLPGGDRRTECLDVRALDVAGNETAIEPVCVDLDPSAVDGSTCAQSGAAPFAVALSLLALRLRRVRT